MTTSGGWMYPSRFQYAAPRSLDEAMSLLREGGDDAKVLAGGQSLVPLMKLRFASPELIVDINNVPGLAYHRQDPDGTLHVGALCRHAELERSTLLRDTQQRGPLQLGVPAQGHAAAGHPADDDRRGPADRRPAG